MRLLHCLALLAIAAPLAAQQPACTNAPERHQFDFWLGDWRVTPAAAPSNVVGTSHVESFASGCGILENWTASNGGSGKSINAYNPASKQWEQYWVGSGGLVTHYNESRWEGRKLVYVARGAFPWQRLSFTPLDDSTVRQFGETSADSGRTWKVGYDFRYHRK